MTSAWENLHSATLELVRSTPIKQRLICAYRRHLASVLQDQLPSEVRASFSQLMGSFSSVQPLRGEDPVVATVRKMSSQEADDCATLIVEIFGLMCRAEDGSARQSTTVMPLRSVECATAEFEVPALTAAN
jgi:hypothetical protein